MSYLWDEVLQRDSLMDLLARFVHLQSQTRQVPTAKGLRTETREAMIFPRYHQLDAVRRLVDARASARLRAQLSDPALGWLRQIQLDRVAGAPAVQPARRQGR